nr:MAG TPA: hypothetical protein [Caudoviricetes sp.]
MTSKEEAKALIEAAVTAAIEASMRELDEKLQAAVNLGVTIGAAAGADVGAKAAVKAVERERKAYRKKQYDWKYQNTKLLLRNYRRLNAYYQNAIFSIEDAEEADESFEDIMRSMGRPADEEIFVESIQKNYLATRIIMTHVNKMLDCYEIMCERSNRQDDKRHWRVLEGLYLSENYTTAEQIAKQEHIDKRTVYKDIDVCAADLTALFFGVGGIERL